MNDRGRTRTSSGDYAADNAISFVQGSRTGAGRSTKPVIDLYEVESDRENNEEKITPRKKKSKKSVTSTQLNATFDTQHDVGISGASSEQRINNRRRTKPEIDLNDAESDREHKKEGASQLRKKKAKKSSNSSIQLKAAPDTQHRTNILDDIPATIDDIIRYMDQLEPSENYYDRQKDTKGGSSKTRGKLRNFAKSYPTNLAVMHWVETGKWQPPNEEVLAALMEVLKNIINKMKVTTLRSMRTKPTSRMNEICVESDGDDLLDEVLFDRGGGEEKASQPRKKKAKKSSNSSIQLKAAAGTQHGIGLLTEMPATIDDIIRYMDQLEPSENYYDRQKDTKGGSSKTRGKLRKWAKSYPTNLAVMHWVETGKWQPPNEEVLLAIVNELKNLIK